MESMQRNIKTGIILILFAGLLYMFYSITQFFYILFAAVLFAVFFTGCAEWLQKKTRLKYTYALTVVLITISAIIIVGGILLAPYMQQQIKEITETLPKTIAELKQKLMQNEQARNLMQKMPKDVGGLSQKGGSVFSNIGGAFSVMLDSIAYIFVILITGVYLAYSPALYRLGFLQLVKKENQGDFWEAFNRTYTTLKHWLWARGITMLVVGIMSTTGLLLLKIPLAVPLGIIAGLLDFVPNVGPLIALIPALLIAFTEGPESALYVALLYFAIQTLEGFVLTPLIEKEQVSLPPALILVAQLFFGLVGGVIGLFLASPILATIIVFTKVFHVKKIRNDDETAENTDS